GWDLAKATGQDTTLPADLVEACFEVVEPQKELLSASGMFGSEVKVADGADHQTRLLAELGRKA
ncbi:MAG: TIGR03086 family protein, partial [Acidimicrobiia bacterium]|nr:TIGR03086 family protein [Acidimicrobiia bacterium]